jgi:hypothetical protein
VAPRASPAAAAIKPTVRPSTPPPPAAGKGSEDFQEYVDDSGSGTVKGWFDDRVEARNALSRLSYLQGLPSMQRDTLPWGDPFTETTAVFI